MTLASGRVWHAYPWILPATEKRRAEIEAIRAQIADLPEEIRDMDLRIDLLGPAPVLKGQRKKAQQRLAE